MSRLDIIRAWKDEDYRASLSQEELAQLPENPAGEIDLSEHELTNVNGGGTIGLCTLGLCTLMLCTLGLCTLGLCTLALDCPY